VYCAAHFFTNLSMTFIGTGFAPASSSTEEDISKVTSTPLKHRGEKAVQQGSASLEDTGKAIFLMSRYIY
jgi:hypothetical protein